MNSKQTKQWLKERNEAVESLDVEKLKAFYRKWQGIAYEKDMELPPDRVLWVAIRKMACNIEKGISRQARLKAIVELSASGHNTAID